MTNLISPAPERTRGGRSEGESRTESEVGERSGPTHRPGDVPASLTRRYLTEVLRGGAVVAFYEGPGAKTVAFHDHGSKLATDQVVPSIIRDMAAVAAHRGWSTIKIQGSDEFRRELWLEARALGLEVKGHRATSRDQQDLARRLETTERSRASAADERPSRRPARAQPTAKDPTPPPSRERADFDTGVAGTLIATGEAPYRRRPGERLTPFIRIDRGEGRTLDIWGVGLPNALKRSGAQIGDAVQVRRDGVDILQRTVTLRDPVTGVSTRQLQDYTRNRWVLEADRFRRATPSEAARDAALAGAQSHLAVLNTVIDASVKDPQGRAQLRAEAKEIVADELARGRRFTPARIREIEPVIARDMAQAHARDVSPDRASRR